MNHLFSNAHIYAPNCPPNHQQSAPPSRPQSHGAPHQNVPSAHNLPPLTSGNHAPSAFRNDAYPIRNQPPLGSFMTTPQDQISQPGSYSVYGPTANTFYNGHNANLTQHSQNQQLHQQSRTSSVNGLPHPAYTSAPTHGRLPDLLPMPPRGNGKPSLSLGTHINQLNTAEEPQPTHVVGSQGRRGILPSAEGRPAAVAGANTSGQKAAPTPPKDADGKYPCPHCTKNYLHAKHLKRHLLRHTGVRPYTCGLCKDTFSRSDILKRHFQKCSVRRGNPSGENHLSHSRANKKSRQEDAARMESNTPTDASPAQPLGLYSPTNLDGSFDMNNLNLGQPPYDKSAIHLSRSNSFKKSKRSTGTQSNRVSLGMLSTPAYDPADYEYLSGQVTSGQVTPETATTSGAATPYNNHRYGSRSNQISPTGVYTRDMVFGGVSRAPTSSNYNNNGALPHIAQSRGGHDLDFWSNFSSNDDYGNTQYHSGPNTPIHPVKSEGDLAALPMESYSFLQHSKA